MASILALKRKIQAASNVSKTTRAMQMIAASKMKRAKDIALSSRPYVEKLVFLSKGVSDKIDEESLPSYMQERKNLEKILLLTFSPDKGLCGGLVTNLIKEILQYNPQKYIVVSIGKKIERHIARQNFELVASFPFGNTLPEFNVVYPITKIIDDYFLSQKVGKVEILSTSSISIFLQRPTLVSLLPITVSKDSEKINNKSSFQLFEPSVAEILPILLKRYIEMTVYQHLLESYLSEQAARMMAMQNATDNANDIIEDLKLEYNKTRQARITSEILDISGSGFAFSYE